MKIKLFKFVSLVLLMLVTGVFWGTWFTLTRSIVAFTPAVFLDIGHTVINNVGIPMRILMPGTIISVAILLWLMPDKRSLAFYLMLSGLGMLVAATLVTVCIEVPIDYQIKDWTVVTLPGNWQYIRQRWEFYHTVRTILSVISFGFLTAGCLENIGCKENILNK